jgi:hypothetical protein
MVLSMRVRKVGAYLDHEGMVLWHAKQFITWWLSLALA